MKRFHLDGPHESDATFYHFVERDNGEWAKYSDILPLIEAAMEIYSRHNETYQNHIVRCRCGICESYRKLEETDEV